MYSLHDNKAFKEFLNLLDMLLKLDHPKIFTDVISLLSELVTEVRIKVNSEGLKIIAIDPANVALVSFKLPAESFSALEANDEEVVGISLDSLRPVLKRAGAGAALMLQTEDNTLKIEIHDKIKREFKLAMINIDSEEKSMPDLDFTCKVEISSYDLSEAITDCAVVGDSCLFSIQDGKFSVEAKGLHSTKSEFSGDEVKIEGEKGKAKYSLEYLQKFIKACKLIDKAGINFADDYPLKLEFKAPNFELAFVLAPRVETED